MASLKEASSLLMLSVASLYLGRLFDLFFFFFLIKLLAAEVAMLESARRK